MTLTLASFTAGFFLSKPSKRMGLALGGGEWFVVGEDAIWYVQNNGADGDYWGANNVRTGGAGAIGWRIPFDQQTADDLRRLEAAA